MRTSDLSEEFRPISGYLRGTTTEEDNPLTRKLLLTVALLAAGSALVVSGAGAKTGGTIVYDNQGDFQFMDPQISYYALDWTVLQATCVKLLNWPDVNGPKAAQLQPEAATGFPKVSNGGRTYDFTVDVPWTKFYPGNEPVTAQSFKNAFDRIMDPKLQSPASQFTDDVQTSPCEASTSSSPSSRRRPTSSRGSGSSSSAPCRTGSRATRTASTSPRWRARTTSPTGRRAEPHDQA